MVVPNLAEERPSYRLDAERLSDPPAEAASSKDRQGCAGYSDLEVAMPCGPPRPATRREMGEQL